MHLSCKAIYGLRILYHVAEATQHGGLARGAKLAVALSMNDSSLEQISGLLRKAGLIKTVRGRNGGYTLGAHPEEITLLRIIEAVDGPLSMLGDVSGEHCTDPAWEVLSETMAARAGTVTLAKVLAENRPQMNDFVI